jgi:glycosyltransferase involved in cell wall biosynthesis
MPEVSVIIPLYNKASYIGRALESVLAQTYEDFEVFVVDDGSTDNGAEIVKSYKDHCIHLIRQASAGPGAARNRGIREGRGRLISFLDADDVWYPEFLQRSVERLKAHPECVLSASAYQGLEHRDMSSFFWGKGVKSGPWRLSRKVPPKVMKLVVNSLYSGVIVCRREVIERYGGFYDKTKSICGEDTYLWLQVVLNHTIYRDPLPLAWVDFKASELSFGREVSHPCSILLDPEPIRMACPDDYRDLLEKFFGYYALFEAYRHTKAGHGATAKQLLKKFPMASHLGWTSVQGRLEILLMPLIKMVASTPFLARLVRQIRKVANPF